METTRIRLQLAIALERASPYLQKAESVLAYLRETATEKLNELRQHSEDDLRRLRASSRDALLVANDRIGRFATQVSGASKHAAVHLQKAQSKVAVVRKAGADKLQVLGRESANELRKLRAGCRDAMGKADEGIGRVGMRMSAASRRAAGKFQMARSAVASFARMVVEKPRRMREARQARENDLRALLKSSLDPVVVTNEERRLVSANPKALELLGISEFNMTNFTIDAFLAKVEGMDVDCHGSLFVSRNDGRNRCKLRRLDGGLRVANCEFVANIVPHRHLYKFLNVAPYKITPPRFAKGNGHGAMPKRERPAEAEPPATVPPKKIPRHGVRPVM